MHLFHFYHDHRLSNLAHSRFWQFEFAIWLHVFARTLISIFVPILLLQIGYSLGEIMIYYLVLTLINIPFNFLSGRLITKIGARYVMMLSNVVVITFFLGLYSLTPSNWPMLITLAIISALYDSLYWVSHIFLFIKSSANHKNNPKNTSLLYIVKRIAAFLGPLIGALILIFTNRQTLIGISIVIFALSLLPLLHIKTLPDKPSKKTPSFKQFFKKREERKNFASVAFFSIHRVAEVVLWPIFIYTIFKSIQSVAYVPMIISVSVMIFSYMVGRLAQKKKENLIILGSFLIAMTWLIRLTIENSATYYISVFLVGLFALLVSIPLDSSLFERAKKTSALATAMYRNTFSMGSKAILFALLAFITNVFEVAFSLAALSLFALLLLIYISTKYKPQKP